MATVTDIGWVALGALLGVAGGIWRTARWHDRKWGEFITELVAYRDCYPVLRKTHFSRNTTYQFSFNGGAWWYEALIGLKGELYEFKRIDKPSLPRPL